MIMLTNSILCDEQNHPVYTGKFALHCMKFNLMGGKKKDYCHLSLP